jgi:putative ABC transport system permease protein
MAIAVLISVVGGVVLAAATASRRTESAFPDFVSAHGFDAEVYSVPYVPVIARLPGVSSVTDVIGPDNGAPTCSTCTHQFDPDDFGVAVLTSNARSVFNLVSGHLPDPSKPRQVVASFTLQHDDGVQLGNIIHVPFYAPSQSAAYNSATPPRATGPTVAFQVVGFEASEFDFPSGTTPAYLLYTSPAFARTFLPKTAAAHLYFVRLRHGAADLPRFNAALSASGRDVYDQNEDAQVASIQASIHPQAIGWLLLSALAALVGLAVVGQALARQSISESEEYPTMTALGVERRQLVVLGLARNLVVGLAGAIGAIAIAYLLSSVAPLGEARMAETSRGFNFDPLVLPLGALATVVVVFALGLWPAMRAARSVGSSERTSVASPSKVVDHMGSVGAPPTVMIGVRNALERKSGRGGAPVGSALLGTVLAVTALCGTAVFGASLSHLTATPQLYGDPFELNISNPNGGGTPDPVLLRSLEHDPRVTAITQGIALPAISINKVVVGAIAGTPIRGQLLLSTVSGHLPNARGQVGLGHTTMRLVHAHVGSTVSVTVTLPSGGTRTAPFRVVAQMSLPVLGNAVSLGAGAVFTLAGYEDAACPPGPKLATCKQAIAESINGGILAGVVPGPRGQAAINYYLDRYRSLTALAITPTSLINFGEAVNFPLIFGAMLAVFGAATLLHLLVVSVSRRRRDVGLLKVVGFVNTQVVRTVAWQATTLALAGIVIGVPVGVVAGEAVWKSFANNLGAVPVAVVPVWLVAGLAAGALVAANLIAIGPALVATRSRAGDLLRTA